MAEETSTQETAHLEHLGSAVRQVLERIKANPYDERFHRVRGSYLFDVEGVGTWRIGVDRGTLYVEENRRDADCIIRLSPEYFFRIMDGRQNLLTAFMQGQVDLEGDMALAQKLNGIMPSREKGGKQLGESK